jgi:pimeloyl-ACP methyl ester carboxylesterase
MESTEPSFVESSDGVRIAVHHLGRPTHSSAPVLLFSHATGFHGRVWEPMAAHLAERFECIALDYRGHGLSSLPIPPGNLAWSGMADDALAVLHEITAPGRAIHGIGHSMGGAALALAEVREPGIMRSLWLYEPVIVPPGGFTSADGPNPMADGATRRRDRFDSYQAALDNFAAKEPLKQLHPDALASYVDGGFALQSDGTVVLRCQPATEAEVFRQAPGSGVWEHLSQLRLPVAIVTGRPEEFGPATFAQPVAAALPHGTLIEWPELGHFGPLEDPAAMAEDVARWVDGHL